MRLSIRACTLAIITAAGALGACISPEVEAKQWDEIQALSATVTDLRAYTGDLEGLVDSLHKIVLRQDTAIRILVDFTGAQVPSYRQ